MKGTKAMSVNGLSHFEAEDRDLERRVKSFLAGRHFSSLRRLQVEARKGVVTLRGRVASFYEKQVSHQCCRRVAGVIEVVDDIEVSQGSPRRRLGLALAAVVAVATTPLLAGCGKTDPNQVRVFPAKGRVQFEGRAAPGAWIVLHPTRTDPQSPCPRGKVNQNGTFTLSTYHANDGAPSGDYTATVEWPTYVGSGEDVRVGPNRLPPKYGNPRTSGLHVRVAEGSNQLPPIELRR